MGLWPPIRPCLAPRLGTDSNHVNSSKLPDTLIYATPPCVGILYTAFQLFASLVIWHTLCLKVVPVAYTSDVIGHPSSVVFLRWTLSSICDRTLFPHIKESHDLNYKKLIGFLRIVVWHMRVSAHLLEVMWLECGGGVVNIWSAKCKNTSIPHWAH